MKIIIFGASGMIGQALVSALKGDHQLILVGRDHNKLQSIFGNQFKYFTWQDIDERGKEVIVSCDLLINLAGENIAAKRWSADQKRRIIDSRVKTTTMIADICAQFGERSPRIMNASAIGIYGMQDTVKAQNSVIYDEDLVLSKKPSDFLSQVANAWENALIPAEEKGVNVVKLRFAVVLSQQGGALQKMLPSFRLGLGAILGSGEQPFSWVTLDDVVRTILFLMKQPEFSGAVNVVAEEVVPQRQFAKTLSRVLHRPCFMKMPTFVVKALFGEMADELLLNGQHVKSKRLQEQGFHFKYHTLEEALKSLFSS